MALNETRRLHLGLAFQSQTYTWGPRGDAMLDYPPCNLRQEVRLKRDRQRDYALQTGGDSSLLYFCLCLLSTVTSTRHPAPSLNTHTQVADVLLNHHQTRLRLLTKCQPPFLPPFVPHCKISTPSLLVLAFFFVLF